MAEDDTIQLHRAIFAQYIMMKKLFMELEEEREASATAASAAMSLIRKLQREKDAERMEAWQYKRIAEEKMNHTDATLEILKEVMEQKEFEISCLRNQLQVYKHKLLDVGINDCDIADETLTSNIPLSESKTTDNLCHTIKRNSSLPTLQLNKLLSDMDINKNRGAVQSARSRLDGDMHNLSDSVWEHVSRDGKALEPKKSLSTDTKNTYKHGEESNSPSGGTLHPPRPLDGSACCSSFSGVNNQTEIRSERVAQDGEDLEDTLPRDQHKDLCLHTEMDEISVHPTSDVDTLQAPETSNTETGSSCTENNMVIEESESSPTVVRKERGPLTLSRFSQTRKVGSMNNVDRHVRRNSATYTPRDSGTYTPRDIGTYTPRAGVERTKSRLKRVQSAKMVELKDPKASKEQIIMLTEVYEQLNMIESHMRPSGSQETPKSNPSLDSVMEAALSFSI